MRCIHFTQRFIVTLPDLLNVNGLRNLPFVAMM